MRAEHDSYRPIASYGVIGNLRTAVLVGHDGSLDWACLPEMDSPSAFGALLDRRKGGRFGLAPTAPFRSRQRYRDDSNVLETRFETGTGRAVVIDFMPLEGPLAKPDRCRCASEVHRVVVAEAGEIEMEGVWAPRLDYARGATRITRRRGGFLATAGDARLGLAASGGEARLDDDEGGPAVRLSLRLRAGESAVVVTAWGGVPRPDVARSLEALEVTESSWRAWVSEGRARGRGWAKPHSALVTRSELAMKLLTYADTGAIAAAPTTSLPEWIGGVRNWDYRFSWVRDSSLTAQALLALGHPEDAEAFLEWVDEASAVQQAEHRSLRILYSLRGETAFEEQELSHLEGYRRSVPVRIGNAAADQVQLDVYGEILSAAYELARREAVRALRPLWGFLAGIADAACERWREPDQGIWEVRTEPRHFVHSKIMCWVALDRALRLTRYGLRGDARRWAEQRDAIRRAVLSEGFDADLGSFVQYFGARHVDAAALLVPLHEFLPFDDPRVQGTLARVERDLCEGELTWRYHADDGLPGPEGAFGLATYWRIANHAGSGRAREAAALFDAMSRRANHLGLMAEQYDPRGEALGNFPQAFTHIGVVNAALYLAYAEGRHPEVPPLGTRSAREEEEREDAAAAGDAPQPPAP
jgi:GH15 family glucan-1,4-alpha-glucosidase